MEDNEFEEVTIISHTDQAASILPQRTAERLMKEIRMEVTQKISPTENQKFGSSQHSVASTELAQLVAEHFAGQRAPDLSYFLHLPRHKLHYLIGSDIRAVITNGTKTKVVIASAKVANIFPWHKYLFVFVEYGPVEIFDEDWEPVAEELRPVKSCVDLDKHIIYTQNFVYYRNWELALIRLDQNLKSTLIKTPPKVSDFFVCPKTETITTLSFGGELKRTDEPGFPITPSQGYRFYILKKMYSDHFLVADVQIKSFQVHRLHLVNTECSRTVDCLVFETAVGASIKSVKLLAPSVRLQARLFLVGMGKILALFCERRGKLSKMFIDELEEPFSGFSYYKRRVWVLPCAKATLRLLALCLNY